MLDFHENGLEVDDQAGSGLHWGEGVSVSSSEEGQPSVVRLRLGPCLSAMVPDPA